MTASRASHASRACAGAHADEACRGADHADHAARADHAEPPDRDEGVATELWTPPVRRVVPDGVFDAYGWCESDTLAWRRPRAPAWQSRLPLTSDNPPGMAFVLRAPCEFLPKELARLHVRGVGLGEEWALAPYGIDDATDELYARRVRPRDLFWLAAEHNAALAWGLHDWAHFHNHGPFEERAWTELQCDATALAWMWMNREAIGLLEGDWETARRELSAGSAARFDEEGKPRDGARAAELLEARAVVALCDELSGELEEKEGETAPTPAR
jgi:hypothetical protein